MTYRFATIGCTHAGYSTRGMRMHRDTGWNLRVLDGQLAYSQAVTQIIDAGCQGLWHGGDVTHWSRPLPRDVESVQRLDDIVFDAGLWNGKNSGNHCAGSGADLSAVAMFDRPTMNAFTVYPRQPPRARRQRRPVPPASTRSTSPTPTRPSTYTSSATTDSTQISETRAS